MTLLHEECLGMILRKHIHMYVFTMERMERRIYERNFWRNVYILKLNLVNLMLPFFKLLNKITPDIHLLENNKWISGMIFFFLHSFFISNRLEFIQSLFDWTTEEKKNNKLGMHNQRIRKFLPPNLREMINK